MGSKYENSVFNSWTVIKREKNGKYLCRCSCGIEKEQYIKNIINGCSKSCGHERNTEGKTFNNWTVIKELGKGKILCKCLCGTEKELYKKSVLSGETKSCGCLKSGANLDILNKRFGSLVAKRSLGNALWECKCDCGRLTKVYRRALIDGITKSCGCKQSEYMKDTMLNRYNEVSSRKIQCPREKWQIETLESKELMIKLITSMKNKPTVRQLSTQLCVNDSTMLMYIHSYSLESIVDIGTMSSHYEDDICTWIKSIDSSIEIIRNSRKLLGNRELDIYLPKYKLAIEFNGNYWHKYPVKDIKYHQDKTLKCIEKGIRLIHIFEYEWLNDIQRCKIEHIIKDIISEKEILYARKLKVKEVCNTEATEFCKKYHLQNGVNAEINVALVSDNNDILALMSFGKSRFDSSYEYELLRLCFKSKVIICGGKEKMFKYFIDRYLNDSVLTYCNLSKFTGDSYKSLGFKHVGVTDPNYVWVSQYDVKTRYQCQKKRLVELGLGSDSETESVIMTRLGYNKIYDSGNLKLEYKKGMNIK